MRRRRFPTLALLLALALGACARGSAPQDLDGIAGGSPSSVATSAEQTTPDGVPGGNTDPGSTGRPADPRGPGSEDGPPPRTPEVGSYRYDTHIDLGPEGEFTGRRTVAYHPYDGSSVLVRQTTQVHGSPERVWWHRLLWRHDGVYRTTDFNPSSGLCTLDPPVLEIRFPVRVGDSWRAESRCVESGMRWELEVTVDRRQNVSVGGTRYPTFVFERALTRASPGADPDPLLETRWFSTEHLIDLRMRTRGAGAPLNLVDSLRSIEPAGLPDDRPPDGV